MTYFVRWCVNKLSQLIALGIILAAVAVILGRSLAPILDKHRNDVEGWASNLLGTPVSIQQVRASWYQYQPQITLKQVTL